MKRFVLTTLTLALALFVVTACSVSPCEELFNKSKTCVASADCSTAGTPATIALCNTTKNYYLSLTYSGLVDLCKQQNPGTDCNCNAADSAAAEKVLQCKALDSPAPACLACL